MRQIVDARLDAVDVPSRDLHLFVLFRFVRFFYRGLSQLDKTINRPKRLLRPVHWDSAMHLDIQIEKLVPQPQLATALGFLIWKD
ncbi:hypothetical protein RHECNPAF_277005 [Rhizobium etli CNPAF512]|nr:hypothetical protein RHECNPAF_277005 [Rhizobium etli CNPAF512]